MRLLSNACLLAAASISLVSAQQYAECNPRFATCPALQALPEETYLDFRKGPAVLEGNQDWEIGGGGEVEWNSEGLKLWMRKRFDAPTIRSLKYIQFGHVEFKVRCAPGQGIVTALVLMSDVQDEIDWEMLGGKPERIEANYYGKGNTTFYDRMTAHNVNNVQTELHTYAIDLTKDKLDFIIDGKIVRTVYYTDGGSNLQGYNFPQTPMRALAGPWAGGDQSLVWGTVSWAGGYVDYSKLPFNATVESIRVKNYSPGWGYEYSDQTGSYQSVKILAAQPVGWTPPVRSNGGTVTTGPGVVPAPAACPAAPASIPTRAASEAVNPLYLPTLKSQLKVGTPYAVTWKANTPGTVCLYLCRGPPTNCRDDAKPFAEKIANTGCFLWTPDTSIANTIESGYGIHLIVDGTDLYQYTPQFGVTNDQPREEAVVGDKPVPKGPVYTEVKQAPSDKVQPNVAANCAEWDEAVPGDWCAKLAERNGISVAQLSEYNPVLGKDGKDCDMQFWAGYQYCFAIVKEPSAPAISPSASLAAPEAAKGSGLKTVTRTLSDGKLETHTVSNVKVYVTITRTVVNPSAAVPSTAPPNDAIPEAAKGSGLTTVTRTLTDGKVETLTLSNVKEHVTISYPSTPAPTPAPHQDAVPEAAKGSGLTTVTRTLSDGKIETLTLSNVKHYVTISYPSTPVTTILTTTTINGSPVSTSLAIDQTTSQLTSQPTSQPSSQTTFQTTGYGPEGLGYDVVVEEPVAAAAAAEAAMVRPPQDNTGRRLSMRCALSKLKYCM